MGSIQPSTLALVPASPFWDTADLLGVFGLDGRMLVLNPTWGRLLGYDSEELVGRRFSEVTHPADVGRVTEDWNRHLAAGERHSAPVVMRLRCADGTYRWIEWRATTMLDQQAVVATGRDVTDRRAVEAEFRLLAENAGDMISRHAPDGTYLYVSPAARTLFGYEPADLVGRNAYEFMHPDEVQRVRDAQQEALRRDEPLSVAYRARHADGRWVWVEITARTLRHHQTAEPTEIHVTARDVTARIRAERALKEAEERFREAFDHAPIGMAIVDLDGRWQQVNRTLCDILGYSRDELCATTWRAITHRDDLPRDEEAIGSIVDGRASFTAREKRYLHADGGVVWTQVAVSLLRDEDGRAQSMVVQVQDISERRRLQEQLESVAATGDRDLLSAMADRLAHEHEQFSRSVLDSINAQTAVVNASGGVIAVNRAWTTFTLEQGGDGRLIGMSYLSVCDAAAAEGVRPAAQAAEGIRAVLAGRASRFEMDYPCEMPSGDRWFGMVVTPLATEGGGAVITHLDITDRKRVEEQLAHQALHDPLTGLPNRALFGDHLALAMARRRRHGTGVAVLFLDLDRFKTVNDSLGHPAGDAVLQAVAIRLAQLVRAGDTVARFGGDEFTVLCQDLDGETEVFSVAERIVEGLRAPLPLETGEVVLGASIGVARVGDAHHDPDAVLRDADIALYRAKERGRGRFEVCDEQLHEEALSRLRMERELGQALERGELRVFFQSIVRKDGSIMGAEALLRWAHPERGLIEPLEFVPLAEETGLIVPIGEWVLREACRQGVEWARRGHPEMRVGVNVSAVQLLHGDLDAMVRAAVAETGLDPRRLTLEITESTFMEHEAEARPLLERLRALGLRIAMDDFGTGYSSLGSLKALPVDSLKLDRAFVSGLGRDPQALAIVTAVVRLAVALELTVVAEGVEDERHLDELRSLGCDYLQGYLFGRPQPAAAFAATLPGAR